MEQEELGRLVRKARSGDQQAMTELLRHAHTPVSYQCRKLMGRREDAEDMVQEVLLKVYQSLDSLKEPEKFNSWANTIAAHMCINQLRRDPRDLQFLEDEEGNSILDLMEDTDQQKVPDAAVDNVETQRMITDLIDALPGPQRTATYLFYFDEMSVKEIARLIGVSESTIKSRLNYARKAIRTGVLDYEKQGLKLYGVSPLPLLLYFLRREMEAGADAAAAQAMAKAVLAAQGAVTAGTAAGEAAGAAAEAADAAVGTGASASQTVQTAGAARTAGLLGSTGARVTAAVLAGTIAVGGGIALSRRQPEPPAETPVPVETPSPVPEPVAEVPYTIRRTTVDVGRPDVVISLETPSFHDPDGLCQGVDQVFDALHQSYADHTEPNVFFIVNHLDELPGPIELTEVYTLQSQDQGTVSVVGTFNWEYDGMTLLNASSSSSDMPTVLDKRTGTVSEEKITACQQNFQDEMMRCFGTTDVLALAQQSNYGKNAVVYYRPELGGFAVCSSH